MLDNVSKFSKIHRLKILRGRLKKVVFETCDRFWRPFVAIDDILLVSARFEQRETSISIALESRFKVALDLFE